MAEAERAEHRVADRVAGDAQRQAAAVLFRAPRHRGGEQRAGDLRERLVGADHELFGGQAALLRLGEVDVAGRPAIQLGDPDPRGAAEELGAERRGVSGLAGGALLQLGDDRGVVLARLTHAHVRVGLGQRLLADVAAAHHGDLIGAGEGGADQHRFDVVAVREVVVVQRHQLALGVLQRKFADVVEQVGQVQPDVVDRVELVEESQVAAVGQADHVAVVALDREQAGRLDQLVVVAQRLVAEGDLPGGEVVMQLPDEPRGAVLVVCGVVRRNHSASS